MRTCKKMILGPTMVIIISLFLLLIQGCGKEELQEKSQKSSKKGDQLQPVTTEVAKKDEKIKESKPVKNWSLTNFKAVTKDKVKGVFLEISGEAGNIILEVKATYKSSFTHESSKGCVRTFNLDDIALLIIANDKSMLKYRLEAVGVVIEEKCKYLFPRHMKFSKIGEKEGEMMVGDNKSGFVSICTKKVGFANMVRFYGCQLDICIAFVVPKSTFEQRILKMGDVEFSLTK